MITISIDEAAAYDLLSILSVKSDARPSVRPDWDRLATEITQQVPAAKHAEIMERAYPILWATNSALFHRINDLKESDQPIDAREIDALNHRRYEIKQQLQKQWFPDVPLAEVKIGYPS